MAYILLLINRTDTSGFGLLLTFLRCCPKQVQGVYFKRVISDLDSNKGRDPSKGGVQYFLNLRHVLKTLNPLKSEFIHNFIYKFSPYLTGNTLRLRYEAQPVNVLWGNSRCLL
jgi:hypothetical protein